MLRLLISLGVLLSVAALHAQDKKPAAPFRWVNPAPKSVPEGVLHGTFFSATNDTEAGYCYLLPAGYEQHAEQRYPVVYWLHGGRPGSEWKAAGMAPYFRRAMQSGTIPPLIYVFPNGGKLSHYDHDSFRGEQAFLELIGHVDKTYRTIADRSARAVEGFSQGGRGTGRYMFKHAELFCSAAPMGGGHQHEQRVSENDGAESASLTIDPPWNNTWTLAERFAKSDAPRPRILIVDGDADFNFEANTAWHAHLVKLGIKSEFIVVPGAKHSAKEVYDQVGDRVMQFHVESFRLNGALK